MVLGLHAVWQARVAPEAMEAGGLAADDLHFYKGKASNARFYVKNILPRAVPLAKTVQSGDASCLEEGLFD